MCIANGLDFRCCHHKLTSCIPIRYEDIMKKPFWRSIQWKGKLRNSRDCLMSFFISILFGSG